MNPPNPRSSERPTMRDVASSADVSLATVSNFVNGRFEQMSDGTRQRVEAVMRRLSYHPDATAQGLRSARTRTLGFLVLDEHKAFLADPLTALLMAGVGDVARARNFGILVQASQPGAGQSDLLIPFQQRRIDGAFVLLTGEPQARRDYIQRFQELGEQFVVFDEVIEPGGPLSVRAAEREGGRQLTEHLIERGHTRIAFIGARVPWAVVEQRFLGYHDALEGARIRPSKRLELFEATGYEPAGAAGMVKRLLALRSPPTAIICGSDLLALAAMRLIRDAHLRVPDDIAVAGFDDFDVSALVEPPLTTVRVPGYEMGMAAATMLIDQLEGHGLAERHVVFDVELRTRAST